ncbi:VanZ family protein [Bacillus aquiflavi]|uniref:VanZ family protein n=1 Tax=Bacillus aquiflavi TaxID=2672567 RepID=UPI001FEC6437|nr:VanZ family protein [Bacillus aquiflavi]
MRTYIFAGLAFSYIVIIWIMSGLPHNTIIELPSKGFDTFFKESLHLIEFAILYLLLATFFLSASKFTPKINMFIALISSFYGVIDEIHQSFVPYRTASTIDVIKDCIGVIVCWYLVHQAVFYQRFPIIVSFIEKILNRKFE